MSSYITLKKIQIQNANGVAGLTYGFPAVTHFLGYVHALSRKLQESHSLTLGGCAIVCHQHQNHIYQPQGYGDYIFAQTRNPSAIRGSKYLGKSSPIIEEGKMHLTVSLVIECEGFIGVEAEKKLLERHLTQLCQMQKLAGGVINKINQVTIESAETNEDKENVTRKIRRRLLPGFLLIDRSQFLQQHFIKLKVSNPEAQMLDAWLDFSSLKHQFEPESDKSKPHWKYIPKPESGYLVPIMTGYRAISEIYAAGEITNARDISTPFYFVEAAYGIGEWQSPHRIENIQEVLWHYHYREGWYLCANQKNIEDNKIETQEENFDPYSS